MFGIKTLNNVKKKHQNTRFIYIELSKTVSGQC